MSEYGVVLFHTTSAVMRGEKLLTTEGYSIKLIPTPRELSSDCGIALRFEWNHHEQVRSALEKAGVEYDAVYLLGRT